MQQKYKIMVQLDSHSGLIGQCNLIEPAV